MKLSNKALRALLESLDGSQIFSVTFIKRSDGSEREMVCRKGVKKHLKGGELSYNPKEHDLMVVFDMQKGEYRTVSFDKIIRAKIDGIEYIVRRKEVKDVNEL